MRHWTKEKAWEWYKKQSWIVGCNYIPATAVNQIEMWQETTYDPDTICKELKLAQEIGLNTLRVYLHYLPWADDPKGFKERIRHFLELCKTYGQKAVFVFFDDCNYCFAQSGKQPEPIPGIHNSYWVQCPGHAQVTDKKLFPVLKAYVQNIIRDLKDHPQVLFWDLYNEPGANEHKNESMDLLKAVFAWARWINPQQPVTSGIWNYSNWEYRQLSDFQLQNSDIISFHNYGKADSMHTDIGRYLSYGRPVICTEYMARTLGSTFKAILPLLKERNIGAIHWGLFDGKTQTKYPWGSPMHGPEPEVWFHNIFHKDGTPYDPEENRFIRNLTLGS